MPRVGQETNIDPQQGGKRERTRHNQITGETTREGGNGHHRRQTLKTEPGRIICGASGTQREALSLLLPQISPGNQPRSRSSHPTTCLGYPGQTLGSIFVIFTLTRRPEPAHTLTVHFPLRVMAFMAAIPLAVASKLRTREAWEMIGGPPFRCVVSVTTGVWVQQLLTTSSSQTHVVRHSKIEWSSLNYSLCILQPRP